MNTCLFLFLNLSDFQAGQYLPSYIIINLIMNSSQSQSVSEPSNSMEPYYKVQAILDKKIIKGKPHYLVWWVGYPKQQATWQPASNLTSPAVKQMCEQFDQSMQLSNISKKQKPTKLSYIYCDSSQSKVSNPKKTKAITKSIQSTNSKTNLNKQKIKKRNIEIYNLDLNNQSISGNKHEEENSELQSSVDKYIPQKQATFLNLKGEKFEIRIPKRQQLKIKNIIKASTEGQNLFFYVSLMNSDLGTKISHEQMKLFYPYQLLDFYESKMKWQDKNV